MWKIKAIGNSSKNGDESKVVKTVLLYVLVGCGLSFRFWTTLVSTERSFFC